MISISSWYYILFCFLWVTVINSIAIIINNIINSYSLSIDISNPETYMIKIENKTIVSKTSGINVQWPWGFRNCCLLFDKFRLRFMGFSIVASKRVLSFIIINLYIINIINGIHIQCHLHYIFFIISNNIVNDAAIIIITIIMILLTMIVIVSVASIVAIMVKIVVKVKVVITMTVIKIMSTTTKAIITTVWWQWWQWYCWWQ